MPQSQLGRMKSDFKTGEHGHPRVPFPFRFSLLLEEKTGRRRSPQARRRARGSGAAGPAAPRAGRRAPPPAARRPARRRGPPSLAQPRALPELF